MDAVPGAFRAHVRGFGFVDLSAPVVGVDGSPLTSCFVPPPLVDGLLTDDVVEVDLELEPDGRATATAVRLVERVRDQVIGVVERRDGVLSLRVDPHVGHGRWELVGRTEDLPAGAAVLADVVGPRQADPSDEWEDPAEPEALTERVRVRHRLPLGHPEDVLAEAARLAHEQGPAVERRDLRDVPTLTIDAPTSRDLDDALSAYPADPDGGIRVLVHIADVAAHVPEGSAVDREARRAGTSAYLPGWTRPMLPPALSDQALSLLPGVDRDALTFELRIADDGTVTAVDVTASRIRSDVRLSYEQAAEVLANRPADEVPDEVVETLRWLRTASARLAVQRQRRGGLEARRIEPETTVALVHGEAQQVATTPSNEAHRLVERLMVATNEGIAGWLLARGLPGVFRVHPEPGPEAAPALEAFCSAVGFHPGFGRALTPLALAALSAQLDMAEETAPAVWDVLLSFLGRARYTPDADRHFGLASDAYLHVTSPLRRYADLTVHRVVHRWLAGERDPQQYPSREELVGLCEQIEEGAAAASRAESQLRKALWLSTLEAGDQARSGRVTGVQEKGVFVTLDGSSLSGFLSTRQLRGRDWSLTADGLALRDGAGRELGPGQQVEVRIVRADPESGQLELAPVGELARPPRRPRAGREQPAGR